VDVLEHLGPELAVGPVRLDLLQEAHPGEPAHEDVVAAVRQPLLGLDDAGTGDREHGGALLRRPLRAEERGDRQDAIPAERVREERAVARLEDVEGRRRARQQHHPVEREDLEGGAGAGERRLPVPGLAREGT